MALNATKISLGPPTAMPPVLIGSGSPDSFVQNLIELHGMSTEDARTVPMHGRTREEIVAEFGAYEEAGAYRAVISVDAENSTAWQRDVAKIAEVLR